MEYRPPPAVAVNRPQVSVRGMPSSPGRHSWRKGKPVVLRHGLDVRALRGLPSWNHFSLPGSKLEKRPLVFRYSPARHTPDQGPMCSTPSPARTAMSAVVLLTRRSVLICDRSKTRADMVNMTEMAKVKRTSVAPRSSRPARERPLRRLI